MRGPPIHRYPSAVPQMERISSNTPHSLPTTNNPPRPRIPRPPSHTVPLSRLSEGGTPGHLRPGQRVGPRQGPRPALPSGVSLTASSTHNSYSRRPALVSRRPDVGLTLQHRPGPPGQQTRIARQQTGIARQQARIPAIAARGQDRQPRRITPFRANPAYGEVDAEVELFSFRTQSAETFHAVFSQRFQYSLIHPSVLDRLALDPLDLPPGTFRQHIICPLGRIMPRRYVGLAIRQRQLGIECQAVLVLVLDDSAPNRGPGIYLGQPFIFENLDGRLPLLSQSVSVRPEGQLGSPNVLAPQTPRA